MSAPAELLALRSLAHAAEQQLLAARGANAAALELASQNRADAQSKIDVALLRAAAPEIRREAAQLAMRVRAFDVRLRACGESVLAALDAFDHRSAPATYGRRGHLRSA